ncbi:hypothetical protein LX32DRAFT_693572 [Colletotrichum zoysiae]|uniref:Uncharacterized protein n=1 Tax=Colletotrichum zoysiae TaxID=1216348 RepID=A0AAD9HH74_9PEZI|nr:hypothetical protein LX32DRAFT_693572 [Colletotrichum zoysiae]
MKSTIFTIIAAVAASVAAIPVKGSDIKTLTMKRSEAIKLGLLKREDTVSDSEEVDAARAHPEDTLGH